MPTYEYECRKCGKRHEAFQSITAKPLTKCPKPKCGGRLKRLLGSGVGLLFKGSGFYITDYRSKSYREAKKKDTPSAPASSSCTPSGCDKPSCPSK
ncbi:MAG: zinc ribbon domain-containing protein [Candidatus Omnitrophica bacterium]|nr:zinc ribbon domain-containing protein [Candidatus Omnitrophota bacterium]